MTAFVALMALGWADPIPAMPPLRLSDPTGDAITHHLVDCGLWRFGAGMELQRDGERLCVRVFLPEHQQSDRSLGATEAGQVRDALKRALGLEGYVVRFADSLWCERGTKGWSVVARASSNPRP